MAPSGVLGRSPALVALLWLLAGMAGCELQRDPLGVDLERSPLGVYSLLVAGEDRARVLVVRFSRDVSVQDGGIVPVGDAVVTLARDGDATELLPDDVDGCLGGFHRVQAGRGCYVATLPAAIGPGDRFELEVRTVDGQVVRGRAVVPGPPTIRAPLPNDTVRLPVESEPVAEIVLRLGAPPDAALLEAAVRNPREPECGIDLDPVSDLQPGPAQGRGRSVRIEPSRADSVRAELHARCIVDGRMVPVGALDASFHLLAYDTAYARYVSLTDGSDRPATEAGVGLDGAVGYFAAANRATVPLVIVAGQ